MSSFSYNLHTAPSGQPHNNGAQPQSGPDDIGARLIDAIDKGDEKALARIVDLVARQKLSPNLALPNGETLLTYVLKTRLKNQQAHEAAYRAFMADDGGIIRRTEMLGAFLKDKTNPDFYQQAAISLSSEKLLNRLNIPAEQWPQPTMDANFYDGWRRHHAPMDETYLKSEMLQPLLKQLVPDENAVSGAANHLGETPAMLHANMQAHKNSYDPMNKKVNGALSKAGGFDELYAKDVNAQTMLAYLKNDALRNTFPWLTLYKPDEATFLNTFDPNWLKKSDSDPDANDSKPTGTESSPVGDNREERVLERGWSWSTNDYSEQGERLKKEEEEKKKQKEKEEHEQKEKEQQARNAELQRRQILHLQQMGFYESQPVSIFAQQVMHDAQRKLTHEERVQALKQDLQQSQQRQRTRGYSMER